MTNQLREKLAHLPEEPGIYKMLDKYGNIIYIGKSKCLKKRVKSYFVSSPKWEKVKKMARFIFDMEYEVTDTHLEAMLLECELIKRIKPYFNVLMKHDDRYVYLKVGTEETGKPLVLVYQREEDSFGPFRSKSTLQDILDFLKNIYPLRKEGRNYLYEYHIFPVAMDAVMFQENKKVLLELCRNTNAMWRFIRQAEKRMKAAANEYKYETALMYRKLAEALSYIKKGLDSYEDWGHKTILLDLEVNQGHKLFFIAYGAVVLKRQVCEVTVKERTSFIEAGKEKCRLITVDKNDKGNIDYRDIIYSELSSLETGTMEIIP